MRLQTTILKEWQWRLVKIFCRIADTKLNYLIQRKLVPTLLRTGDKSLSVAEPCSRKYAFVHAEFQETITRISVGIKIRTVVFQFLARMFERHAILYGNYVSVIVSYSLLLVSHCTDCIVDVGRNITKTVKIALCSLM